MLNLIIAVAALTVVNSLWLSIITIRGNAVVSLLSHSIHTVTIQVAKMEWEKKAAKMASAPLEPREQAKLDQEMSNTISPTGLGSDLSDPTYVEMVGGDREVKRSEFRQRMEGAKERKSDYRGYSTPPPFTDRWENKEHGSVESSRPEQGEVHTAEGTIVVPLEER